MNDISMLDILAVSLNGGWAGPPGSELLLDCWTACARTRWDNDSERAAVSITMLTARLRAIIELTVEMGRKSRRW